MEMTTEKNFTVPDITWPKDFPELKLIDDALRCGICYDYIKTCMVTPCAHSYCSICIRRSLLYKTACPICFEETFETNLRNNRVLDRVAELFISIRDKIIKHIRIAAIHFECKEQNQSPLPSQNLQLKKPSTVDATPKRSSQKVLQSSTLKGKLNFPPASSTSSSAKKSDISKRLEDILGFPSTNKMTASQMDVLVSSNESDLSKIPTVPPIFLQPKVETQPLELQTVACPVCNVDIPERNINAHLDNCLANSNKVPVKSPVKPRQKRIPLSKMVWSMMAEKELRRKLKDFGLNTQGEKKILISRIQRYVLLYNSECDSDNPRSVSEIIRQVEREEKQQPAQNQQRLLINKKTDPRIIEEENKKYLQDNKNNFKKLIETMKERDGRNIRPTARSSNCILSDDENDVIGLNENKHLKKIKEIASTLEIVESVVLSDSNDSNSLSSSPILGSSVSDKQLCNEFSSEPSGPFKSSEKGEKNSAKSTKVPCNNLEELSSVQKSPDLQLYSNNNCLPDSPSANEYHSSPARTRSPSCIITTHSDSDSEESFSILTNHNNEDDDFLHISSEAVSGNVLGVNSQTDDPDFIVDTEEQLENENNSEEVFMPRRKSKRKLNSAVLTDSNQNTSPRRTRRRLCK